MIITILFFIGVYAVCAQEIKLNKDSLFYQPWLSYDTIKINNIGTADLIIDSIYTRSYYGYNLSIKLKDTSMHYTFVSKCPSKHFSLEPNDSAIFIFSSPFCALCKSTTDFKDTVIIHSNSIVNSSLHISIIVKGGVYVENNNTSIHEYKLYQNYPNPFNPTTSIPFSLTQDGFITFIVYNALGQRVYLIKLGKLQAGDHEVIWDATNYTSGTYFYCIESTNFNATRKMVFIK